MVRLTMSSIEGTLLGDRRTARVLSKITLQERNILLHMIRDIAVQHAAEVVEEKMHEADALKGPREP